MENELLKEAISKSFETWTIMNAYIIALILLFTGSMLQFATGFYERSLDNFKIKLSGENWAVLFFVIRDFSLFGSFVIGILLINPDMFADVKLPLPFFPAGVIFLGIALIIKLKYNLKTNTSRYRIFNLFLVLAAFVQYFGFVLVAEAASEDWIVSGTAGELWIFLQGLRPNLNPSLSMWTFYICFPILIFILAMMTGARFHKLKDGANH